MGTEWEGRAPAGTSERTAPACWGTWSCPCNKFSMNQDGVEMYMQQLRCVSLYTVLGKNLELALASIRWTRPLN